MRQETCYGEHLKLLVPYLVAKKVALWCKTYKIKPHFNPPPFLKGMWNATTDNLWTVLKVSNKTSHYKNVFILWKKKNSKEE